MGYSSMRHIFGGSYDSILPQALSVWKGAVHIVNLASVVRKLTCRCRHGSEVRIADWVKSRREIQTNKL